MGDDTLEITYNVRVLNGRYADEITVDGTYQIQDVTPTELLEKIYPVLVDEFETTFPEAQLQYNTPDSEL